MLVDLEACGTLAIEAHPSQADAVVRALAAGLATSLYAEVAHLITVSLSDDVLLGHRNAHQHRFDRRRVRPGRVTRRYDVDQRTVVVRIALAAHGRRDVGAGRDPPPRRRPCGRPSRPRTSNRGPATGSAWSPRSGRTSCTMRQPAWSARPIAGTSSWLGRTIPMTPIGLDRADVDAVVAVLHDAEQPLIWMDDVDAGDRCDGATLGRRRVERRPTTSSPGRDGSPFEPMEHTRSSSSCSAAST